MWVLRRRAFFSGLAAIVGVAAMSVGAGLSHALGGSGAESEASRSRLAERTAEHILATMPLPKGAVGSDRGFGSEKCGARVCGEALENARKRRWSSDGAGTCLAIRKPS